MIHLNKNKKKEAEMNQLSSLRLASVEARQTSVYMWDIFDDIICCTLECKNEIYS